MCMWVHVHIYMHACMWRPEIYLRCLNGFPHFFLEISASLTREMNASAGLGGQHTSGATLLLVPQLWAYRCTMKHLIFYMGGSGSRLRSSCFYGKRFSHRAIPPAQGLVLLEYTLPQSLPGQPILETSHYAIRNPSHIWVCCSAVAQEPGL